MSDKFYLKQHDLMPFLKVRLLDETTPVTLIAASTVVFNMSNRKSGLKISAPMHILEQEDDAALQADPLFVVDPAHVGVVAYEWVLGDSDTVGEFNGEFQVTWAGVTATTQTFPAHSYVTISIEKDLDGV